MNRVITFGKIEYKNERSVRFAQTEYTRHAETKAKLDLIFRPEAIFGDDPEVEYDKLEIEFERSINDANNKTLTNTINALNVLLQYAIAGRIDVFVLEAGELPRQVVLQVNNDKSTVHTFNAGMEAYDEGRFEDAIGPLTDAIDSCKKHVWAITSRGLAYYEVGKLEEAELDFKTANEIYPAYASPYLGLAKIAHARGQRREAIDSFNKAMKSSILHQPGYWICGLLKAEVLMDLIESGTTNSAEEQISFFASVKTILDRYESKLGQLGSARNDYYPSPEELKMLKERFVSLQEEVAAGA